MKFYRSGDWLALSSKLVPLWVTATMAVAAGLVIDLALVVLIRGRDR